MDDVRDDVGEMVPPPEKDDDNFFKVIDAATGIGGKEKLDTLLTEALTLLETYETKKRESTEAWRHVENAQKNIEREMLRQGIKSFQSLTTNAKAIIVEKNSCDYDPQFKPAVFEFLKRNDAIGLVSESVRKDTLANWILEFVEHGGKCPLFIQLKVNRIIQIRRR